MLYARQPTLRTRQVVQDAALVIWIIVWWRIGLRVFDLVEKLGTPPEKLASAGRSLQSVSSGAGDATGKLPLIGDRLSVPFTQIGRGGTALVRAGEAGGAAAHDLAVLLALLVALLPIAYVASRYLPGRIRWSIEADAAAQVLAEPEGTKLLAMRALTQRPLAELRRVEADPMGAFDAGRYEQLAAIEAHRLGVELPTPPMQRVPA